MKRGNNVVIATKKAVLYVIACLHFIPLVFGTESNFYMMYHDLNVAIRKSQKNRVHRIVKLLSDQKNVSRVQLAASQKIAREIVEMRRSRYQQLLTAPLLQKISKDVTLRNIVKLACGTSLISVGSTALLPSAAALLLTNKEEIVELGREYQFSVRTLFAGLTALSALTIWLGGYMLYRIPKYASTQKKKYNDALQIIQELATLATCPS